MSEQQFWPPALCWDQHGGSRPSSCSGYNGRNAVADVVRRGMLAAPRRSTANVNPSGVRELVSEKSHVILIGYRNWLRFPQPVTIGRPIRYVIYLETSQLFLTLTA